MATPSTPPTSGGAIRDRGWEKTFVPTRHNGGQRDSSGRESLLASHGLDPSGRTIIVTPPKSSEPQPQRESNPWSSRNFYWQRAEDWSSFEGGYSHEFKNGIRKGIKVDALHVQYDDGLLGTNIGSSANLEYATIEIPVPSSLIFPSPKDRLSISFGTASANGKLWGNGKSELALEATAIGASQTTNLFGNERNDVEIGVGAGFGGNGALYRGEDTDNDGYGEWGGKLGYKIVWGGSVGIRVEPGLVKDKIEGLWNSWIG
jgi:hypothetical protein